jgi:hypothetical protein
MMITDNNWNWTDAGNKMPLITSEELKGFVCLFNVHWCKYRYVDKC